MSSKQKFLNSLWKKIHLHFNEKECNHLILKTLPNGVKLLKTSMNLGLLLEKISKFLNFQKGMIKMHQQNMKICCRLYPLLLVQDRSLSYGCDQNTHYVDIMWGLLLVSVQHLSGVCWIRSMIFLEDFFLKISLRKDEGRNDRSNPHVESCD